MMTMTTAIKLCSKCGGEGVITVNTKSFSGKREVSYQTFCDKCNGRGRIANSEPPAQDAEPLATDDGPDSIADVREVDDA